MAETTESPRLYIPALAPLYDGLADHALVLIRIVLGVSFIPSGWVKLFTPNGIANTAKLLATMGLEPAVPLAYWLGTLEFFGGILLVIGLFTRPVAFMFFIEMAVATFVVHLPKGFFAGQGGVQLVELLSLTALAFAIRGGGRFSVDRVIGKEF